MGGSGLDRIQFLRIRIGLGLKRFTVRSSLGSMGFTFYGVLPKLSMECSCRAIESVSAVCFSGTLRQDISVYLKSLCPFLIMSNMFYNFSICCCVDRVEFTFFLQINMQALEKSLLVQHTCDRCAYRGLLLVHTEICNTAMKLGPKKTISHRYV